MSDYTMTVEVPVHLTLEFDEPLQVDKDTPPSGIAELNRIVEHAEPTDEFKQAVTEMVESDTVSVNHVYAANGYTVSSN